MRKHEEEEKRQHADGAQKNERRVMQRVGELATERFGTAALRGHHLKDVGERAGAFADTHQRHIHSRKQRRMACRHLGKAFAGKHACPDRRRNLAQPAELRVARKKFERMIEPGTGFQQQCEIPGERRNILGARSVEEGTPQTRCRNG